MRPGSADIVTATTTGEAFVFPAFPWTTEAYPGAPDLPLSVRAEATKREFWESRLSAKGEATP